MDNGAMFLFNDDEDMQPKSSVIKRLQEDSAKCIEKKKEDEHVDYTKLDDILRSKPYTEAMIFTLQMDREIDKVKHYISPGGYEFKSSENNESLQFDFCNYSGYVDVNDKSKILFECEFLDNESFPSISDKLTKSFCENINEIVEFYIYTGEDEDPELNLSKIIDISLLFIDGTKIDIKPEVIDKFNDTILKEENK